jgi:hypothetical protein
MPICLASLPILPGSAAGAAALNKIWSDGYELVYIIQPSLHGYELSYDGWLMQIQICLVDRWV